MIIGPWARMASLGCVLAVGCGGSSSGGTGGAGGGAGGSSGGAGGAVGTGGSSADSGAGGAVSCGDLPACVASVVSACPLAGSCLVAASGSGNVYTHDICFGDGVKVVSSVTVDPNTSTSTSSISVSKSGATCYTLDGSYNAGSLVPQVLTFKNASGTELATFSTDFSTTPATVTVTCGGQSVVVANFGNCGMPQNPEPNSCGGGACTAP